MRLRILSGGQTGVDQAALRAARAVGFETGGWAPLGWETESGPPPWLADYGLIECPEAGYVARRQRNVQEADSLVLIGDLKTTGSQGTIRDWARIKMGAVYVAVTPGVATPRSIARFLRDQRRDGRPIESVLVAGNRESKFPGIGDRAEWFLTRVFRLVASGRVER
jgi:Circularly permutated YpsA SLOG family